MNELMSESNEMCEKNTSPSAKSDNNNEKQYITRSLKKINQIDRPYKAKNIFENFTSATRRTQRTKIFFESEDATLFETIAFVKANKLSDQGMSLNRSQCLAARRSTAPRPIRKVVYRPFDALAQRELC